MKKSFLIFVLSYVLIFYQNVHAQVIIEQSSFQDQQINIPADSIIFAEYMITSPQANTYLLIDTCDMSFLGVYPETFSSQSFRKIRMLVNGEEKMSQMMLPANNHWQFYPGINLGFPYGGEDSALVTFVADLPDTVSSVPNEGESLTTILFCRYHFSNNTFESIQTETSGGQTIYILSSTSGVEIVETKILPISSGIGTITVLDPPLEIHDCLGNLVEKVKIKKKLIVSSGIYSWKKGNRHGKVLVR